MFPRGTRRKTYSSVQRNVETTRRGACLGNASALVAKNISPRAAASIQTALRRADPAPMCRLIPEGPIMRSAFAALALTALSCTSALAAAPDAIRAASGGDAWHGKAAVELDYDYAGQGLTGKASGVTDLKTGAFEQHYAIGPQ